MNSHLSFTTFTLLLFMFLSIACSSTDDPNSDGDFDKTDTEQELDENPVVDGDESESVENAEKDTITDGDLDTDILSEQEVIVDCNQIRGEHHKSGRQDPETSCFGCHSSNFCSNCHNNNDHPTNYGGKMHNSGNCCQWCHGPSRTGGIGPACSTCH